jgi:hypothetical protein
LAWQIIVMAVAVLANQRPTKVVEDLQQQARDFHIPEFSPPWTHQIHTAVAEANKAAEEWAVYHFDTLVGAKRFSKIMEANITDGLAAGVFGTGPAWGLELAMEYFLFLFVLDDEVLHRASLGLPSSSVAQIFLELLLVMMSSFPREKVLEEALERMLAVDEKWELAKRPRIEKFLAQAVQYPGTGNILESLIFQFF